MVMEHLAGPTLAAVVRDYAPLPLARALWIFSGICAAVEAGHRRGVVHRDLKPGNVILARGDDDRETVKVLDFGLARIVQENEISVLTNPGTMLGTCSYMAPELIEANLSSKASDIYALGVVLYEMVTGRSPFRAENNAATIWKITTGDYERPGDLEPDLPQEVCAAIEAEIAQLEDDDKAEFLAELGLSEAGLARVIRAGYDLLGLQTFFTAGVKEVRAWTVRKGSTAPQGAGKIHTDFEKGFIRAEVIAYEEFIACKGEQGAKDAGKWRLEGKEYVLVEGDVVHFRFNV